MVRNYTADIKGFYKKIFDNDEDLKNTLYHYDIASYKGSIDSFFYRVINLFLKDISFSPLFRLSSSKKIYEEEYRKYLNSLKYETESPLYLIESIINEEFNMRKPWVDTNNQMLYTQLFFTFFYGNVKSYFYENRKRFLPEYDWFLIENNENKKAHIEGFFREFDKFSEAISYMADLKDIEKASEEKIAYISAVLGIKFDLEDDTVGYSNMPEGLKRIELFSVSGIRNLLKNIVEIFREKGGSFAYELFFNSIGIDVSLKETYFDRRLYWRSTSSNAIDQTYNPETDENKTNIFFYYLTSSNPSTYYFHLAPNEKVSISDLTAPKTESAFNHVVSTYGTTEEKIRDILGYGEDYDGETFTFFKTNVLLLDFKYYTAETQEESYISLKHRELIRAYIDMITPIYIKKYYPSFKIAEAVVLERMTTIFKSGSGYMGYYDKNGEYRERSRSEVISRNTYFDEGIDASLYGDWADSGEFKETRSVDKMEYSIPEREGFPNFYDIDYEDHKDGREILHETGEKTTIRFNKIDINIANVDDEGNIIDEVEYFSFKNSKNNILNNIDFTWLPSVEGNLTENGGYIDIDYYSYLNPVVAVGAQNLGGNDIIVTITEEE